MSTVWGLIEVGPGWKTHFGFLKFGHERPSSSCGCKNTQEYPLLQMREVDSTFACKA